MMQRSNSRFRGLKIGFYSLVIFIVLLLIVPFLIDFSKFKPQIQQLVKDHVQASLEFESARLQLIPAIGIKLTNVSLENTDSMFQGTKLFSVNSVLISARLWSLIQGKVIGNIVVETPELVMIQKGLKNNLASLSKPGPTNLSPNQNPSPSSTSSPERQADPQPTDGKSDTANSLKDKVVIEDIIISNANLTVNKISPTGSETIESSKIQNLNFKVTNLGVDRDISLSITTSLNIKNPNMHIIGDISLNQTIRVNASSTGLEKAVFSGNFSANELLINFNDAFVKARGIPLNLDFSGTYLPDDFILQHLNLNFHNFKVESNAHVVDFKDPRITAKITASNENLASLGDVLPKHKSMLLNGQLKLDAGIDGKINQLNTLTSNLDFDTKLTGGDLHLDLKSTGALPFKGKINVKSSRLNIDSILAPFKSKSDEKPASNEASIVANEKASTSSEPSSAASTAPIAKDFELTVDQKKLLIGTDAELRLSFGSVQVASTQLSNIKLDLDVKDLQAYLHQLNIDGFGGKVFAKGHLNLQSSPIGFSQEFNMTKIHPEMLMAMVKPQHKNLMTGKMDLNLSLQGSGTTIPTLNRTLNGLGDFKFLEGQINTPSISEKLQDEFDQFVESLSVSGLGDSVISTAKKLLDSPLAKAAGKNPPNLDGVKDQFKSVTKIKIAKKTTTSKDIKDLSGKLEIKNGKLYVVSKKVDSSGTTDIQSNVDLEMNLGGGAHFSGSESTKQDLLSQSKYADLIFDDKGNFNVDVKLSGTVMDPKVSLAGDTLRESFKKKALALIEKEVKTSAENYIKNLLGGGQGPKSEASAKAKEEAKKQEVDVKAKAAEALKKNEGKAKEALKGFFGK